MIANAAFARPARIVVLHAKSLEDLERAIVHADRQGKRKRAARRAQHFTQARIEFEFFRRVLKLSEGNAKRIEVFRRGNSIQNGHWRVFLLRRQDANESIQSLVCASRLGHSSPLSTLTMTQWRGGPVEKPRIAAGSLAGFQLKLIRPQVFSNQ